MHENMNNAYEDCFTRWMDYEFAENATFEDFPISIWKEHSPWVQPALKQGWVEAMAWIKDLENLEVHSETFVRISFDCERMCDDLHLLDQDKWAHEIKTVKRMYHIVEPCAEHNWVPNPREMNEHTTYSCTICNSNRGCA